MGGGSRDGWTLLVDGWWFTRQEEGRVCLNLCEVCSLDQCGPGVNLSVTKQAPLLNVGTEELCCCCDS